MSADCQEKKKAAAAAELVTIETAAPLTLAAAQEKLARATGPQYWRSLHELADDKGFQRLLYDPDRSQTIQHLGEVRPWGAFLGAVRQPLVAQKSLQGAGIRFLTETVTSPTMAQQMRDLLKLYPQTKWHQYDPVNRDALWAG